MEGDVKFAEDGTMTLLNSLIGGWGDSLVGFSVSLTQLLHLTPGMQNMYHP